VQQLGNRLASIAMEKAGIVKPGRPAVSGVISPEAKEVIERVCRERGAPLKQIGADFHYAYEPGWAGSKWHEEKSTPATDGSPAVGACSFRPARLTVRTSQRTWPRMELSLLGEHQAANAAVAVACIEQLRQGGWQIPDRAVADGLANVYWPARLEVVGQRPLVVLDCAHNVASAEALVKTLAVSFPAGRRLLVFASSNDKDVPGIFRALAPHFGHVFLTRYGNNPRSVPPQELAQLLRRSAELPYTTCATAAEAWQAAREMAAPSDLVCITGSVFLAGELRPVLLRSDFM
jgi:dihydrofolate synthase/folylpolyglutamate synthase